MKQFITKNQWDEITDDDKDKFLLSLGIVIKTQCLGISSNPRQGRTVNGILPNIGQMIEFLIDKDKEYDCFIDKYFNNQFHFGFDGDGMEGCNSKISIGWDGNDEFCDALWEEVKNKLNK
jgi:hypothetical protein